VSTSLPRLHAITDERIARRSDLDDVARDLANAGGSDLALHARGRQLSGREHYDLAVRLSVGPTPSLRSGQAVRLFVNDRLDIALAVPSAGVQLGRGSLSVSAARALNPRWWIGKSVHDLAEAEAARTEGADYLVVGPVYATASHPGRRPLGLKRLEAIVVAMGGGALPVIAIGGITADRVGAIRKAGAYGIAAIRAFWDAGDAAEAVRLMREDMVG
jgi:thiamine-phosphate pyrophosphorylase